MTAVARNVAAVVISHFKSGVDDAAVRTGSRGLVGVERLEQRREVLVDRLHLDLDPVNPVATLEARPFEPVELAWETLVLDDQADRVGIGALGRVIHVGRHR